MSNKRILQIGLISAIALVTIFVFSLLTDDTRGFQRVDTSVAMTQLQNSNAREVQIDDREQRIRIELREPITYEEREGVEEIIAQYPARTAPQVFDAVQAAEPDEYNTKVTQDSFLMSMLGFLLPMLLLFGLLFFFLTRMQGGGGMFGFGGSKHKELTKDMPTNTFADVAGADEAVSELEEIKDFLQDPTRYHELGAKIPRGVLLYGPPGTGKTLLARAVAGEAGVPFYSISGSDFVEMFVGVGASRVRDLFKQAKENSPCIIFVDEIDAVGRQRGSGMGGGHDEREQTLNQLLVEMDGFGDREGVILMAATNRPDILDPALLRPGRFDRQIPVTNPDLKGREMILSVHAKGKPLGPDADLKALAKRTAGMSGADLANVLNEAALLTARSDKQLIDDPVLDEAIDRVIAGPQKRTRIMSAKERKITAYHEGGHALVAAAMNHTDPVTKVTILPRGRALGYTMVMPVDDKYSTTRNEILDQLAYALGGRVAEEIIFHDPTTGAANDIEKATSMARKMVTEYGMSERVGAIKLGQSSGEPFLGRDMGHQRDYSEESAAVVDDEVRRLIESAHDEAWHVINDNRDILDRLVLDLLEHETLNAKELAEIFKDIRKRPLRPTWLSSDLRVHSDQPPVLTPAEQAAINGRNGEGSGAPAGATVNPGDPSVGAKIDQAARAGSGPDPEQPVTEIIEVPDGGRVDTSDH